jgi:type IV secretion system protein VirB10
VAIAEKTILDPEPSKPGIPLKKSTLAVLLIILLGLGFVSSLMFAGTSSKPAPSPVAKDASEIKHPGNNQVLNDEEARAARAARSAASAAVAARPAASAILPIPPGVKRDDNTAALYDQGRRQPARAGGRDPDLELEATTRMARALAFDVDEPKVEQSAESQGASRQASGGPPLAHAGTETQAPSAAMSSQIDAFRKQLTQQMAGPQQVNWLNDYARETNERGGRVIRGYQPSRGLVLRQGKVIPAVLGRQINSDLPGRITAYVSSNVYDADGQLLIPMGSSLVGRYDSGVKVGQSRLMFAFERLILPNGYSFDLPAAAGTDLAGASGMTGDVNNHFFKMFGTSLLIAILADKGTKQPSSVTQVGTSGPVTAAGQVLSDVSKTILERNRTIPPTITVDQGARINVEVVSDMVFPESYRPK